MLKISQCNTKDIQDTQDKSHALQDSLNQQFNNQKDCFEQEILSHNKELQENLSNSKEKIDQYEKFVKEKLALHAPVTYWRKRIKFHSKRIKGYFSAAFLWGIGGIAGLWALAKYFLGDITWSEVYISIPLWHFPIAIMALTLYVWLERILVRLLMSNAHLKIDAGEKVAMIQTYLALFEQDKIPNDDDRKLMLAAIFRSNATGIVKNDGMPSPLLELLRLKTNS